MQTSGKSEAELATASRQKKPGWKNDGNIDEVTDDVSQNDDPMFKVECSYSEADQTYKVRVFLVDKGKGAWLLRRLCAARGIASNYDAGSVDGSDLIGPVRLKVGLDRRGWLKVEDFAAPGSAVVNLNRAAG